MSDTDKQPSEASAKPGQNEQPQTNGTVATPAEKKLSGAELKKLKQQEKAARRAAQKETQGASQPPQSPKEGQKQPQKQQQGSKNAADKQSQASKAQLQTSKAHQQTSKARRGSETKSQAPAVHAPVKQVRLFSHLYGQPRRHNVTGVKDIHPAVVTLGLQISSYEICGSNARCVAMLLAFKSVIQSYVTPSGTSLPRHLVHHLSPQIDYLKSCRPISVSMGNAIRWLKDLIVKIDPSLPETTAKSSLNTAIDGFIRERITAADTLIAEIAAQKIVDGDVILTFAKSSIVLKTLLAAHKAGTRFRVAVVDSKPLFEGKRLAEELADHGLDVQYNLISAASHAIKDATKVFLGAHAMMGNGRLYSRVGTAVVAMLADQRNVPVIVCCESIKFTDRVALDSIVANEVAPAEELLQRGREGEAQVKKWRETERLQLLNIMYDVTPAEYVRMVVTEYGSLPPSSVPAVLRNLGTI